MTRKFFLPALVAVAALLGTSAPRSASAQKALVYCPVGIDAIGCTNIAGSVNGQFPGGVDKGFNGSDGTVDLAAVDLSQYSVIIVPSLADGAERQPYAMLRSAAIAERLRGAITGRIALWSGTPDQGTTNADKKNALLNSLSRWAGGNFATVNGPGLVVLQDRSETVSSRYDWAKAITGINLVADPKIVSYSSVRTLTAVGSEILGSGTSQIAYSNMASLGFYLPEGATGVTMDAVGQTGTTTGGQIVLITSAGGTGPRIWSDKDDYAPHEATYFGGTGWQPGENITLTFTEDPEEHSPRTFTVAASDSGTFSFEGFRPDDHDAGIRFVLTAVGQSSGNRAETTFTDAIAIGSSATNSNGSSGGASQEITINAPAVGANDLLIAQIVITDAITNTAICPVGAGWTSIRKNKNSANTVLHETFWYRAAAVAGATSYTWQLRENGCNAAVNPLISAGTKGASGGVTVITGALVSGSPIDISGASSGTSSGPFTAPDVTTTTANARVMRFFGIFKDVNINPAPARSYVVRSSVTKERSAASWDGGLKAVAGSTGTFTAVPAGGAEFVAQTIALKVATAAANVAPTWTAVPDKVVNEGSLLSFVVTASDDPAQTLTYSVVGSLPTGATFDPSTRTFSWTPTEAQGPSSPNTVTLRVSDGSLTADESFDITVNEVNSAPALSEITDKTINELSALSGVTAAATDTDLPTNTLTYSLTTSPAGMTINSSTGAISWTPTEAQDGTHAVTVQVTDGSLTDTEDFQVTVNEVNLAPVWTAIANQSVNEGTLLSFVVSATDGDAPPQGLTYSVVGTLADGATFNAATKTFSWTPSESQGPSTGNTVTLRVSDGVVDVDESFDITVNEVNVAPTLGNVPASATIPEMAAYGFTATAGDTDLPAQTLTFSLGGTAPTGASIGASSGVFSWNPSETQGPGVYTFDVNVSDGVATTTSSITLTVEEVNQAPVWTTIGNRNVDELSLLSFTVGATDGDLPGQTLVYSVVGSLPTGASFDAATRTFSWTPSEVQGPSSPSITLRVGDGTVTVDETFTVTVAEVNVAPELADITNKSVNELTALSGVTASATDSDLPANTLTYSLTTAPTGMSINSTSGAISWTPTEAQDGVHDVTVQVSDGNLTDTDAFQVTVNEVNVAPAVGPITATQVNEGSQVTFTATATDSDIVGGSPQSLTFSLGTLPSGVTGTPAITSAGVFTWTPTDDNPTATTADVYSFIVQASDGSVSGQQSAQVTVNNVAPVLGAVTVPVVPIGVPAATTATASYTDAGSGDTHTAQVQWDTGGVWETATASGGTVTATRALPAGVYTVTLKVIDDDTGNATSTATTYVVVYDPNGGFVTGGGWFDSPIGACKLAGCTDDTIGKANFGFVSKYQKGANAPTGNTEFQFKDGNLNFRSTSYQWLVIAGARAQYKGTGTVNGAGNYGFLITALDAQINGGPPKDAFRIKIWHNVNGVDVVVYDNAMGSLDDSPASTALGGGSIVIHTK